MKMNFKKIAALLMITAAIIVSGNFAQAQQGPPPIPNTSQIKKMVVDISTTLELNDVQSKQVFDLYTAHFDEVKEKTQSGKPSRNKMEALKSEFEKKVKSILTDEQQEQFEKFMKKQGHKQNQR